MTHQPDNIVCRAHRTCSAQKPDWLAADTAALDCIAMRIARKFGVSAEVIAKRLRVENLWWMLKIILQPKLNPEFQLVAQSHSF